MNGRERILAALNGRDLDRVPLTEIGIWPETIRRWRGEGLPEGVTPHEYFGLDRIEFFSFDGTLGLEERVLSRDAECQVYSDGDGCTYRMFIDRPVAPQFVRSSVRGEKDWRALQGRLRPEFARFDRFRKDIVFGQPLAESQSARYERSRAEQVFTVLVPTEPCWYYLRLLGEEEALATIATDPDFAGCVIADYNRFSLDMVKDVLARGFRFDALWVFSDLCYKNGMLFSPRFYIEKVLPHQKELFNLARDNGMKVIYHCDGYIEEALPLLIRAGIDCIQPLEARAGNDVRRYIERYPGVVSFMGNIDMDVFTRSREEIEREVTGKLLAAKGSHRYLFHSDHSVPDNVSLESYHYALQVARAAAWY